MDYYGKETEIFKEAFHDAIKEKAKDSRELIIKAKTTLGQIHSVICKDDVISEISVDTDSDEKILNIFVRTNDGGMKLEKADLLLSYMESNKILFRPGGARQEIHSFVDGLNKETLHKPDYGFEKDDVLKACLVMTDGLDVQYKLINFNQDNLGKISENWGNIKKYLEMTVQLIARYGFSSKNVISKNALIPIAYFLMKKGFTSAFVTSQANTDLQLKSELIRWLVISQLSGAFGGSSDTTLQTMRKGIDEGKNFIELIKGGAIDREAIIRWVDKEQYQSRYSHLILMLVAHNKYWDYCHQDHIFPISKFEKEFYEEMKLKDEDIANYEKHANSIANLHLLNPSVNIVKSNDSFIDWQNKQNADFLKGALIPNDVDLSFKSFLAFIEKRKMLIIDKLSEILILKP